MNEEKGQIDAGANASAAQHPATPPQPPTVEGHQEQEGENGKSGGLQVTSNKNPPPHWTRYVEAACTLVLVLITGIYTYYARNQADAAIKAANAAEGAVMEAQKNRAQADKAFNATVAQFRLDQRAWIGVIEINGTLIMGTPLSISVGYKNTGKSPAINVVVYGLVEFPPKGILPTFNKMGSHSRLGILPPNAEHAYLLQNKINITQPYMDFLATHDVVVHGKITYDDIFLSKPSHWITYCAVMSDDRKKFNACTVHNDTDDNK